jgi:chromosome segregation ATPase
MSAGQARKRVEPMTKKQAQSGQAKDEAPFGPGPFDEAPGGGLLDSLRADGEQAVSEEIAGLQAAMQRVDSFTDTLDDADLAALKNEWLQIQADLKKALQTGLQAVEDGRTRRHQVQVADEIKALESEVTRKNDLIAQLSDSVKSLNREIEEKDRRLRDELRSLRDRAADQEEELEELRARSAEAGARQGKLQQDLDAVTAERDELWRNAARAGEEIQSERALQEERYAALQQELNDLRQQHSRLEGERRDVERRLADLDKRLQASEKSRAKAETERDQQAQDAAKASKDARGLGGRVTELEAELAALRDRTQKEIRKLKRLEGKRRGEIDMFRSRAAEALVGLQSATSALQSLPREAPEGGETDEGDSPPTAG